MARTRDGSVVRTPTALLASFLLACVISACGWHLRGSGPGASLEGVNLLVADTGAGVAASALTERWLQVSGAELVGERDDAEAVLVLLDEGVDRHTLTVDPEARIREYELRYWVSYRVETPDGEILLEPVRTTTSRAYNYDRADVLSTERREEELESALRQDAVRLMLMRVQAVLGDAGVLDVGQ